MVQVSRKHQAFVKAAESFFRPEFFNRLDRIILFNPLSRDEMGKIAELVLAEVFQRDGLVRRRCALAVEGAAMERIVDAGYHPQFGARALKRAIECDTTFCRKRRTTSLRSSLRRSSSSSGDRPVF